MEPLNYQTEAPAPTPIVVAPKKLRGHGFLLTLITLMIISLVVWAYFLYCVPEAGDDDFIYSAPVVHHTQQTGTSSIEADLDAAGNVDNSSDLNDIDQAFN